MVYKIFQAVGVCDGATSEKFRASHITNSKGIMKHLIT